MGMEMVQQSEAMREEGDGGSSRPGILLVGAPAVGKTSILNRLMLSMPVPLSSSDGIANYDWTIDTKYYTANVGIMLARLMDPSQSGDDDLLRVRSVSGDCEALVMVFDLSNDASFDYLQNWASRMDLSNFEILLCVGNKADKVPDHYGHTEYRHKVQRRGESSSDPHPEYIDYGIQRTEGSALLSDEQPILSLNDKKISRIAWCLDNGIEYIEACAIDEVFDDCLSVDGDVQGIYRIRGALSAHMWRGLVMKGNVQMPVQVRPRDLSGFSSGDESDFSIQYELLADEGFTDDEEAEIGTRVEVEVLEPQATSRPSEVAQEPDGQAAVVEQQPDERNVAAVAAGTIEQPDQVAAPQQSAIERTISDKEEKSLEEFENFMREMAGMRENLSSMPDAQRREMASQIAMRMAAMFGDESDGD